MISEIKSKLLDTKIFIPNEYFYSYLELLNENFNTVPVKGKTQQHHIIPRNYFKKNNMSVDNSENNLITLYFKDHVLAHYYLSLCMIDIYKYGNIQAFLGMTKRKNLPIDEQEFIQNLSKYQELYEEGVKINSESHKGKDPWNKGLYGYNNGHEVSNETKEKIRDKALGRYKNDIAIHKDNDDKHVKAEDVDYYLLQGYEIGRSDKYKEALSSGYNYSVKGMLGKNQSEYQKQRAREINSHPRSEESKRKQKESLNQNRKSGKYVYLRNPSNTGTARVNKENVQKYLDLGYTLCKSKA